MYSGYNLPRFWEVEVCTITECYGGEANQSSGPTEENCFNRTDVVKTELRENNYYISVMAMISGNQGILIGLAVVATTWCSSDTPYVQCSIVSEQKYL